jgi:hypothetical protein
MIFTHVHQEVHRLSKLVEFVYKDQGFTMGLYQLSRKRLASRDFALWDVRLKNPLAG